MTFLAFDHGSSLNHQTTCRQRAHWKLRLGEPIAAVVKLHSYSLVVSTPEHDHKLASGFSECATLRDKAKRVFGSEAALVGLYKGAELDHLTAEALLLKTWRDIGDTSTFRPNLPRPDQASTALPS